MSLIKSTNALAAVLALLLSAASWAQADAGFDHQHRQLDQLLRTYVDDQGFVDYQGLLENQEQLAAYEQALQGVDADSFSSWPEAQRLAFWINAYNAFTLRAIVDNYPIKRRGSLKGIFGPKNSILQIPGVWKELEWQAAGQTVTLDEIEHEILRVKFEEPRIHFAIVCASISCPNLRNEAFIAAQIDTQLDEQLHSFIADMDKGVSIDADRKRIKLSKIFSWFGEDFDVPGNNNELFSRRSDDEAAVLRYLARYLPQGEPLELLRSGDARVSYLEYDWNLNEQSDGE